MHIRGLQEVLSKALGTVAKAIATHNTLPILENISMKAAGSVLTLVATDLEISVHTTVEVEVIEEGAVTVPAKLLVQYLSLIPQGTTVDMQLLENLTLLVKTPFSETKMRCLPAEDYPLIPSFEAETTVTFDNQELLEALSKVVFSTSTNMTRPILAGVLMRKRGDKTSFASTDSVRLSEHIVFDGQELPDFSAIVPAKTIYEVLRIFPRDHQEQMTVSFTKNQVRFALKDVHIISRLIEGEFPDYAQIIPKETKTRVVLSVEELTLALRRVNLFAKENNNNVKFALEPDEGRVRLFTDTLEIGEDSAVLATEEASGEAVTVALNAQFVLDVLGNIRTTHVALLASAAFSPFLVRCVTKGREHDDYMHLIMPLRVSS
ncbi:DNA polymerase III subunit beta [Candidatus Gracilibacteria bacterium CG17_big_fil_post_rev_8_21_14_2_50_48_13]|nr:MAG: DNA polymerase III subunit beta [Candidatus Gracilibacteria bacterium CG17_big_fil_post_rev_8_21_14_2_50_48_13]